MQLTYIKKNLKGRRNYRKYTIISPHSSVYLCSIHAIVILSFFLYKTTFYLQNYSIIIVASKIFRITYFKKTVNICTTV